MDVAGTAGSGTAVPDATAAARPAPAGAGPTASRGPATEIAAAIVGGVLGAGMVVMPPVVAALTGSHAVGVWTVHVLLGASVSLVLAVLVRGRVGSTSLAGAVGALLGPWAEAVVEAVFAIAFAAGQAGIAWFVATCLLTATGGSVPRAGAAGLGLALGVLLVAVVAALSPLSLSATVLRVRPWGAGAVALACAAWGWPARATTAAPTPLVLPGLSPVAAGWLALAALFFAGVGWETVTTVVPLAAAGARRTVAGVLLGAALVAAVYLGLATVLAVAPAASPPGSPMGAAPGYVLAGAVAVVLTSYCLTNVRTAARILVRVHDRSRPGGTLPPRAAIAAVGAASGALAWAGARDGAVPLLMLGPAAAALTGYTLASVAALRRGGPLLRCTAAVVLLALVGVAASAVTLVLRG